MHVLLRSRLRTPAALHDWLAKRVFRMYWGPEEGPQVSTERDDAVTMDTDVSTGVRPYSSSGMAILPFLLRRGRRALPVQA